MENINLDKIIKADELDFNMILNVPEEIGKKIHQVIQGQATDEEKNGMNIELIENPTEGFKIEDSRKMIFKMGDQLFPISILDLPCIIEANKTIDYKTYYKSSDISQMLYVHENKLKKEDELIKFIPLKNGDENFKKILWKKDLDHKYKLKHGLAKCTRNIRSKRFKRKLKYNHDEILEVAKKLKTIIDNGASILENKTVNTENVEEEDNKSKKNSVVSEQKKEKKKKNNNVNISNNKLSISLPLVIMDEGQQKEPEKVSEEKQNIVNEYSQLKEEYMKIKNMLENMETKDPELAKKKKTIKKKLKALKVQYKETQ